MSKAEILANRVLKKHNFDLEFKYFIWFLVPAIKENEFFSGRTPKWIVYVIIVELMDRHYGRGNYPVLKKDFGNKITNIKS